ncbi:MAG TPA: IclR family transcriptional regulator [Planctomycetota bacterium]|jgi:DNA-binding IclR family transcriptional regulator
MKPRAIVNGITPAKRSRYHVPNLERALLILELLRQHPAGLTGAEIASALKLSKNSIFRITMTLLDHGYLLREEDNKRFALSRKLLILGYSAVGETNLIEKSLDVMRDLRNLTTESVILGALMGDTGVALEQVPGLHPFHFTVQPGTRLRPHTSAPGKALLAFLPADEREALIERLELPRFNSRTVTRKGAFRKELATARALGYAVDRAEEFDGVHCVAAPILDQHGYPAGSIWTTGPACRLPLERFDAIGKMVGEHAQRISRRLGYGVLPGNGA